MTIMFNPLQQSPTLRNSPGRSKEGGSSVKSYQVAEEKRETKGKRKRKAKPVMEFDYEPVRLPSKPHYEDVTQDEGLKFLVPKLRK